MIKTTKKYHNREISWLAFNERVLQEASDPSVPLVERLRFLGIFSNNLDEFFRVRVATVRRMKGIGKKARNVLQAKPKQLLQDINSIVKEQQKVFAQVYTQLRKDLEKEHIYIVNHEQLSEEHIKFLETYFIDVVRPRLVPVMLNYIDDMPRLTEYSVHLAVKLSHQENPIYSIIEIPPTIDRFLVLPKAEGSKKDHIILLDDIIRLNLGNIFKQFEFDSVEAYTIKITRDAELTIDADISKSLIEKISKSVEERKKGEPVRFIYDRNMPPDMLALLLKRMKLQNNENNIPSGKHHNFKDFMNFPTLGRKEVVNKPIKELTHPDLGKDELIFDVLKKKDVLLHYPYQKFSHLNDLLREAAIDPKVTTIKMTLYRVAKYSSVANSLINAAKNGKKVIAVVELQARFDEESNIYWAKKMQEGGVHVVYGVPHLKVHAKMCLITRYVDGERTRYANFSTGNFNEKTAKVYSDMSLLTSNEKLTYEANKIFQFCEMNYKIYDYKYLLVSPHSNRSAFTKLIDKEIELAKQGKTGYIMAKMNSLVDVGIINKLYEASNAGVTIKLIVRGICNLIPQQKGMSENIEVISIVDKFLEHARIFVFGNNGKKLIYLSSADWMQRNLDYRVEVSFPIFDKALKQEIEDYLDLQWSDNTKARLLNAELNNEYRTNNQDKKIRAQVDFYEYLKNKKSEVN